MDNPLYGDENSKTIKIATYTSAAIVGLIGLITFVLLAVFTFVNDVHLYANFAMIIFLILQLIPLGILLYWQRTSYLEPKLRILMIITPILFIFGCAVALFYVFGLSYPGQDCFRGSPMLGNMKIPGLDTNLYTLKENKCYPSFSCFYSANSCVGWDESLRPRCGYYNSTTMQCTI
ncbi:hypothetical protein FDP41_002847 [Naegleria fowleri]|uniref:Uncharacterized protein n=1 Tax=Naegleria fowleri TaxID=5763 RepID=A0A6A5BUE2_NAEFO|nr:uncharacterized protein FDP41_002847 [Naegleria fowleri]KAF0978332.1 hypothetical protein FDP41_002847 [Naegleria fowleri]CAG4718442.1 unnamed protein product [Naegleria fowleri]